MGNAIVTNVNLDHEVHLKREAIEAGTTLQGEVIIQVQERLDPTSLTLEVNGKEKTTAIEGEKKLLDKHCFFRADVILYKAEKHIEPQTYVFPFGIALPKSLPSSRSYQDEKGSFCIEYNLKLKTKTRGKFPNKRSFEVTSAVRADEVVPCLLQPKPIHPEALGIEGKGELFLGAHVRDTNILRGQELQCSLACRNESTLKIDRAVVSLEEEYYYTTKTFGGYGEAVLCEKDDVKRLPGIRVVGLHNSEVGTRRTDEETIARRMFKDLKSKGNVISLQIPTTAKESYTGLVLQVSHFLKFSLITRTEEETYPSIRIPIQIGSERLPIQSTDLSRLSDETPDDGRVRYPRALALPENIVLGRSAGALDNEESITMPIPAPATVLPSLNTLREEMVASINDYDFLVDKLKDLDWAIFFASLNPDEYGEIISLVGTEFAQPRVAGLLAKNYGGDFTCAHCAAAIRNVSPVFRSNMVEGLLAFCSDLSENNHMIRGQLTDFEQIIVALHALNEEQGADEEDPRDRSLSSRRPPEEVPQDLGVPMDILIDASNEEDPMKPPSDMTLETALRESERDYSSTHDQGGSGRQNRNLGAQPRRTDVLIGVIDHPATIRLIEAIKEAVDHGDFSEYCPPVYRQIRRHFAKDQRFLIRPIKENPNYWRETTKIELIEQIGLVFDTLRDDVGPKDDQWNDSGIESGKKKWQQDLHGNKSDWELAVTVHTYASGIDEVAAEDVIENKGPSISDICFFKPKHPGNAVLVRAIRQAIQQYPDSSWSPPIYRAIKKPLFGRRYFVQVEERAWREASQVERREHIEKYFNLEKSFPSQKKEKARQSLKESSEELSVSRRSATTTEATGSELSSRRNHLKSSSPQLGRRVIPTDASLLGEAESDVATAGKRVTKSSLGKDSSSGSGDHHQSPKKIKNREKSQSPSIVDEGMSLALGSEGSMALQEAKSSKKNSHVRRKSGSSLSTSPKSTERIKHHSSSNIMSSPTRSTNEKKAPTRRKSSKIKSPKYGESKSEEFNNSSPTLLLTPTTDDPAASSTPTRRKSSSNILLRSSTTGTGESHVRRKSSSTFTSADIRNDKDTTSTPRKQRSSTKLLLSNLSRRGNVDNNNNNTATEHSNEEATSENTPRRRKSSSNLFSSMFRSGNSNNNEGTTPVRHKSSSNILGGRSSTSRTPDSAPARHKSSSRLLLTSPTRIKELVQGPPINTIEFEDSKATSLNHEEEKEKAEGEKEGNDEDQHQHRHDGEMILNDTSISSSRRSLFRRLTRRNSIRAIEKRNMRHPRDMDVCYGSEGHPGTIALTEAAIAALHKFAGKPWSPAIYKSIRSDLQGRRFFIRNSRDSPWREASAEERVSLTQKHFEMKRRERRR